MSDGLVSLLIAGVGLVFFLTKRTVFSITLGLQWLGLGVVAALVSAGTLSGRLGEIAPFAFLAALIFVALGVLSLALLVRLLYLRKRVSILETRGMRH